MDLTIEDEEVWRRSRRCRMHARPYTHEPSTAASRDRNVIAPLKKLLVLLLSSNSQLSRHHCSRRLETWSRTVHFLALISWKVWKTTRLTGPLRLAATTGIPPPTLLGPLNGRLPACMRSMERLCKRLRKGFVLSSVMRLSTAFLQARRC